MKNMEDEISDPSGKLGTPIRLSKTRGIVVEWLVLDVGTEKNEHRTSNIERPTSNIQSRQGVMFGFSFDVGRSMFDVGSSSFKTMV